MMVSFLNAAPVSFIQSVSHWPVRSQWYRCVFSGLMIFCISAVTEIHFLTCFLALVICVCLFEMPCAGGIVDVPVDSVGSFWHVSIKHWYCCLEATETVTLTVKTSTLFVHWYVIFRGCWLNNITSVTCVYIALNLLSVTNRSSKYEWIVRLQRFYDFMQIFVFLLFLSFCLFIAMLRSCTWLMS